MILLVAFQQAAGQAVGRFYYNKYWELTRRETANYFRVCVLDTVNLQFAGVVRDFTKDGKLVMTGNYVRGMKNGEFVFQYLNGKIEMQGQFVDNQRTGRWKYFHPNGRLKQEVQFVNEGNFTIESFYDSVGNQLVKSGTGPWREEYRVYKYSKSIITRGKLKNYLFDGDWTSISSDGTLLLEERYRNGKFVKGEAHDTTGRPLGILQEAIPNKVIVPYQLAVMETFNYAYGISGDDYPLLRKVLPYKRKFPADSTPISNEIYTIVEESASPSCGMGGFYQTVANNIRYPPDARRMGIEGRVYVEFVIEADGSLSDFRVIKGIGKGCDEEALRVIEMAAKQCVWNPGVQRGKPVRQRYTLPVIFKLG